MFLSSDLSEESDKVVHVITAGMVGVVIVGFGLVICGCVQDALVHETWGVTLDAVYHNIWELRMEKEMGINDF